MTNFRDPAAIVRDTRTMIKFWHAIDGLYVSNRLISSWEFLTTLSYEWSVIRRHRPYRWTIWIYSLTRMFALLSVIADVVILDIASIRVVGCHAAFVTQFVLSYSSLAAASLLIQLRILAIWNRNKVVVAIAAIIWLTNGAILIQGTVQFRAVWVSDREGCAILDLTALSILSSLRSSPTPFCFSSCSSACCAWAFTQVIHWPRTPHVEAGSPLGLTGRHHRSPTDGVCLFELEWWLSFLCFRNEGSLIAFGRIPNIRSAYRHVPEALADIDVNCLDTDASRSDKFLVLRYVRFSSIAFLAVLFDGRQSQLVRK
ncbi:hypothetical protein BC826DRAFT_1184490 [Russula brevipes]|nr:hypothetical protein BC826DRAFT_1184490 [Russula brevipes]